MPAFIQLLSILIFGVLFICAIRLSAKAISENRKEKERAKARAEEDMLKLYELRRKVQEKMDRIHEPKTTRSVNNYQPEPKIHRNSSDVSSAIAGAAAGYVLSESSRRVDSRESYDSSSDSSSSSSYNSSDSSSSSSGGSSDGGGSSSSFD